MAKCMKDCANIEITIEMLFGNVIFTAEEREVSGKGTLKKYTIRQAQFCNAIVTSRFLERNRNAARITVNEPREREREKGAKGEAFEKFRGNLRTRCVNFISRNMQRWRPCKFNDHFSHSIRSFPKYWMFVHGANLTSNSIKPIYLS